MKEAVAFDRNQKLEREASELTEAFSASPFKGYSLLKKQHRAPAKAIMPPESDFTAHYSNQYKPGTEQPLVVDSCDLPASEDDYNLSRENFDSGVNSLNENRSPGVHKARRPKASSVVVCTHDSSLDICDSPS